MIVKQKVSDVSSAASKNAEMRTCDQGAKIERELSSVMEGGLLVSLILLTGLFYVFTYNSGYGYDCLEYLVIGRAVANGTPFFTLIPSKSPGIYYLIAGLFSLGLPQSHAAISAVIALLFGGTLMASWLTLRKFFSYRVVIVATVLIAACAIFMEMNFLEPESVVVIFGLAAYALLLRSIKNKTLASAFVAGILLAAGFQFKSVSAFYALGFSMFLVFRLVQRRGTFKEAVRQGASVSVGFLFGSVIPFLFFAAVGKAADFWLWTIKFPLLYYPANTFWLQKLYTKLLWFHVLLLTAIVCSVLMRHRRSVWQNDAATLAFFMGLASYLALLKTQASHYCFPGAAFFSIFIAATFFEAVTRKVGATKLHRRRLIAAVMAPCFVIVVSAMCYRPQAASRFVKWRNFDNEYALSRSINSEANPGQKALFVRDGAFLYWLSGLQPGARFVNFEVQTTYFVEHEPNAMVKALQNSSITLVEFNPLDPGFEDARFIEVANRSQLLTEFTKMLNDDFRPAPVQIPPYQFWVRKTAANKYSSGAASAGY